MRIRVEYFTLKKTLKLVKNKKKNWGVELENYSK